MDLGLAGRVAVITGPAKGMGAAITRAFAVERHRTVSQQLGLDVVEGIDADHCVDRAVDGARDHRHDATVPAYMELRRPGAEDIDRDAIRVLEVHRERARGTRRPDATVLGAERAAAGARRDFGGLGLPVERERDVPAMARSVNQHLLQLATKAGQASPLRSLRMVDDVTL